MTYGIAEQGTTWWRATVMGEWLPAQWWRAVWAGGQCTFSVRTDDGKNGLDAQGDLDDVRRIQDAYLKEAEGGKSP
jgi:hypothetical protein